MQSQALQMVIALGMVGLAASWWLHHVWRSWSHSNATSSCGGCSGCSLQSPGSLPTEAAGFVPLSALELPSTPPAAHRKPLHTTAG